MSSHSKRPLSSSNRPCTGISSLPGDRVELHQMLHVSVSGSNIRRLTPSNGSPSGGSATIIRSRLPAPNRIGTTSLCASNSIHSVHVRSVLSRIFRLCTLQLPNKKSNPAAPFVVIRRVWSGPTTTATYIARLCRSCPQPLCVQSRPSTTARLQLNFAQPVALMFRSNLQRSLHQVTRSTARQQ
jgi:hypothetical protein